MVTPYFLVHFLADLARRVPGRCALKAIEVLSVLHSLIVFFGAKGQEHGVHLIDLAMCTQFSKHGDTYFRSCHLATRERQKTLVDELQIPMPSDLKGGLCNPLYTVDSDVAFAMLVREGVLPFHVHLSLCGLMEDALRRGYRLESCAQTERAPNTTRMKVHRIDKAFAAQKFLQNVASGVNSATEQHISKPPVEMEEEIKNHDAGQTDDDPLDLVELGSQVCAPPKNGSLTAKRFKTVLDEASYVLYVFYVIILSYFIRY